MIWARVPKDLRDHRVLRDTKVSARDNDKWHLIATGFQPSMAYNSALQNKLSFAVFGFRKTIADGTREKRDCLPSLLEQKQISLFYRNSL